MVGPMKLRPPTASYSDAKKFQPSMPLGNRTPAERANCSIHEFDDNQRRWISLSEIALIANARIILAGGGASISIRFTQIVYYKRIAAFCSGMPQNFLPIL